MRKPPFQKSVQNALRGIFKMLKNERNFQIELFALLVNIVFMMILDLSKLDSIIILSVCFAVLSAEMFNTSIEKICDFIEPNYDEKIGLIKDIAAGGVLLMTLLSLIVGVLIYYPYLTQL